MGSIQFRKSIIIHINLPLNRLSLPVWALILFLMGNVLFWSCVRFLLSIFLITILLPVFWNILLFSCFSLLNNHSDLLMEFCFLIFQATVIFISNDYWGSYYAQRYWVGGNQKFIFKIVAFYLKVFIICCSIVGF